MGTGMNRHIRRVFNFYAVAVLITLVYVPWRGRPLFDESGFSPLCYRFFWDPPTQLWTVFSPDFFRILLEILSLTLVLALAVFTLWGADQDQDKE